MAVVSDPDDSDRGRFVFDQSTESPAAEKLTGDASTKAGRAEPEPIPDFGEQHEHETLERVLTRDLNAAWSAAHADAYSTDEEFESFRSIAVDWERERLAWAGTPAATSAPRTYSSGAQPWGGRDLDGTPGDVPDGPPTPGMSSPSPSSPSTSPRWRPEDSIPGSINDLLLLVRERVRQMDSADEVRRFVNYELAATIARLEGDGEGSREQRVDLVLSAVGRFSGSDGAGRLAGVMLGYLDAQQDRTTGYYSTVGSMTILALSAPDPALQWQAAFLMHHALRGVWKLVDEGSVSSLDSLSLALANSCAFNSAAVIGRSLQRRQLSPGETASGVLQDLLAVAAAAASPLGIDNADDLARALGLARSQPPDLAPIDILTVVGAMGGVPTAWGENSPDLARLEALSGVVAAAGGQPERVAARFFNAGVSLSLSPESGGAPLLAELLLNALGLRWALHPADNLIEALTTNKGLDCAVNFLGTVVQLTEASASDAGGLSADFANLAGLLANVPSWRTLQGHGVEADLARLASAAQRIELQRTTELSLASFKSATERAIHGLRAHLSDEGRPFDDVVLDTANLVRLLFTNLLQQQSWALGARVDELARLRAEPAGALRDRYSSYVVPLDDPIGSGPFVPAGVIETPEWEEVAGRLLSPLDALAPVLADFSP